MIINNKDYIAWEIKGEKHTYQFLAPVGSPIEEVNEAIQTMANVMEKTLSAYKESLTDKEKT